MLAIAGCVDVSDTTILTVDVQTYVPGAGSLPRKTSVEVYDIRETVKLERTALNQSMGKIRFEPSEEQAIRQLVQAKSDSFLAQATESTTVPEILCGIRVFDVTTPSTLTYWDMTTEIELILRVGTEDRTATGKATARTYIWPTAERLQEVTDAALIELSESLDVALTELFAPPVN